MQEEPAVQVKNAELTLESIRKDILEETEILTGIHAVRKKFLEEMAQKELALVQRLKDVEAAEHKISQEHLDLAQEKKDHISAILRSKDQHKVVEKQKNEAMRELSRVNDWILTGENTKKDLDASIQISQKEEADLQAKKLELEGIPEQHRVATENLAKVKLDTALAIDEAFAKTDALQKEAEEAVRTRDTAHGEAETEKFALVELKGEQARIKKDLDVYIARVEEKFGEAFPDLRMNI